ncbi:MAG TPA: YicC/YloC family endoribonuclease, partial [Oceanipulchritudo sp.]|nr:YicC/YloC family endoribonuclease [Oceanipulchritudo sp.]
LDLSVEISSVNRRNLETSVSLPREWQSLEKDIQSLLRDRLQRGKVHVNLQVAPTAAEAGFHWDEAGLESSLRRLGKVAQREGVSWPPDADALIRLAALNKVDAVLPPVDTIADHLLGEAQKALLSMIEMRSAEGTALEEDLNTRMGIISTALDEIRSCSLDTIPYYREVLLQRLSQANLEIDLSDERVLKEIAIFADRCDTTEELTRLDSHLAQFRECMAAGSPVGRKLEFILQEVNREFNTIGSKANNIDVSRHVIEAKNEIERIREQIQNIE